MGSRFVITIVAESEAAANKHIDDARAEITRIEKLISSWDDTSETSLINKNAGIQPVKVNAELFGLIERAKKAFESNQDTYRKYITDESEKGVTTDIENIEEDLEDSEI